MSQGLGVAQRRLLSALYTAPSQGLLRWELDPTGEGEQWVIPRGVYPTVASRDFTDGSEFYLVAQLNLAEVHHPILRDSPRRSPELRKRGSMSWFDLNEQPGTPAERDMLRSWRSAYRRAARSLATRKLIETVQATAPLEDLGQLGDVYGHSTRNVVLARITAAGRDYVQQRRAEFIDDSRIDTDDLCRALRAAGFHDVAEPPVQPSPPTTRTRRHRIGVPRKRTHQPPRAEPEPVQASRILRREGVVTQLAAEGFAVDHIDAVLRAWHREEQRRSRALLKGDNGATLDEQWFGPEEIDDLRQRLERMK